MKDIEVKLRPSQVQTIRNALAIYGLDLELLDQFNRLLDLEAKPLSKEVLDRARQLWMELKEC